MIASASALLLSACGAIDAVGGGDSSASPKKGDDITVGLLLPDTDTARFEKFDHPLIKKRVASLTHGKGKVSYANAGSSADRQAHQFAQMISEKVDVILVDAVDSKAIAPQVQKAKDAGIPVIAYDRLAEGPIAAYVSHDNELVGEVQGRAIVDALGDKAESSKIVMMNGSLTDPNTASFRHGALSELKGRVVIAKSYYTKEWLPSEAEANMKKAIRSIGIGNIAAVYSANDGMAGAVIDALKSAGVEKMPPVTGQDADLAAVQRVVAGEQRMSVYKSFLLEATGAADLAVAKVQGKAIEFDALAQDTVDSPTEKSIPAHLVPVVALTKDNIKSTVIKDGVYTVKDICTAKYADDCAAIGLQ
ncbi:substrate-binding domain-containing protein [Streptomyces spinosirectus]|jgi:D-xylose transport system substrate-binding protein|uniref:sugar ABC transporter substrate-binding protein n=1 Tax=Streptomyces TaxID=1883 RepID=UPI000D3CD924|nr:MULTISPECIES: substrate-binding domain-containing protein [Streptomyces]MBY8343005.1 substrate-binding domain-containing protein [Streptomyces plumbidurans]UIR22973.1 substrate-binding domain-containing protein [Streptomyces spinosirectus]